MEHPELLIDRVLNSELENRRDNLYRARIGKVKPEELLDYEEDVANAEQAIRLWKRVRP